MPISSITIVTVCLNAEKVIEKTMTSVLDQTYDNLEYIIVDGASADNTMGVVKEVKERYKYRKVIVKSESDNGIYDAMNKAIDLASGEWIIFMNAGDGFYNNGVLSKLENVWEGNHDVVFGNELLIDGIHTKLKKGRYNEGDFPSLGHQCTFVRTQLMKKHHFNLKYKISADFEFLFSLYKGEKSFLYVDEIINTYDMGGLSANHRALLYKEHCEIRGENPSKLKMLKYKIEDALPVGMMNLLLSWFWYDK